MQNSTDETLHPEKPVVLVLGPRLEALSGVSTHVRVLLDSTLPAHFRLVHFPIGSEGHEESCVARLCRLLAGPCALAAAVRRHGAAIVHLNTSLDARAFWRDLGNLLAAKLCGAKVVYQIHGGAPPERFFGRSRLRRALARLALGLPQAIVVLARKELEAYRRLLPGRRLELIPNAIDCEPYSAVHRVPPDADTPLHLVYIGRLAPRKGLDELLHALALLTRRGVRCRLSIAGSGAAEQSVRETAATLGLDNVSFVGPVRDAAKAELLARADVFVLPSYSEGLPYALLEAMAAGVAVIVTPVGAIPDVVTDGLNGRLVPPADTDALAAAIAELAGDRLETACMGAFGRRRVVASYSVSRLAADFRELYATLCAAATHERMVERGSWLS